MIKAAGILFVADGKVLLLKRSASSPHPKEWALAGGHIEEGETAEQAARREFQEECGHTYTGSLLPVMQTNDGQVDFTTFLAVIPKQFQPKLNDEHTAYLWCDLDDYPNKTHPAVKSIFATEKVRDAIISSATTRADTDFKESDHPRGEDGKFGGGGSEGGESKSTFKDKEWPKTNAGLFESTGNREKDREIIQGKAEELANKLKSLGVYVDIQHSGSAAGPSSYINLPDILRDKQIRISAHSKGVFGSTGVVNVASEEEFNEVVNYVKKVQEKRKEFEESEEGEKQKQEMKEAEEKAHQIRLKNAQKKLSKGRELSNAEKEALEIEKRKEESRSDDALITEFDIAKQIRDKSLTSPQKFSNVWLFALRISGTGLAYRAKHNEYVNRLPENYLSEEFLARCNGLPVIWIHPENDKLDSQSFSERVIGTICLPYIEGDEVWGIAKVWDETAAQNMCDVQLSTSPGVVFQAGTNEKVQLSDGSHVLIEGKPTLLDHLAIVENGVWDKGGEPSGVLSEVAHVEMTEASRNDSADQSDSSIKGDAKMAEETVVATPAPENEILSILKSIAPKLEGIESRLAALEAAEEAEVAEIAKPDAETMPAPELPVAAKKDAEVVAEPAAPAYVADVEDMKARLDAAEKELGALKATAARADNAEESAEFAKAQGRADAVEQAYGDAAPRPLSGDTVMGYEKRQVMKHLHRSNKWAKVDINAIADKAAFEAIRDEVYADSIAAARACVGVPDGSVRAIKKMDGGREITQFIGKSSFVSGMGQKAM